MKTKFLKIISVLLCICVVIALFFATTRVSDITVEVASSEVVEAEQVDAALQVFLGKNVIALNKTEMINHLKTQCPAVKVTGIVKKFPNQIVVQVRERKILFSVKTPEGYEFIDEEGVYLGRSTENAFLNVTGTVYAELPAATNQAGEIYASENGYNEIRTALYTAFTLGFDGKELATLLQKVTVENGAIKFYTRTGATLLMESYHVKTAEKMQYLLSAFVAGSDKHKITGTFVVYERAEGGVVVDWTE
ncbi:MAG: FtsQ-type POTRA domain-containing protein [Clostridiales bacterium]|nr:FtsQ-type POTRA domain-containing protein [Clostridiales bacterium]